MAYYAASGGFPAAGRVVSAGGAAQVVYPHSRVGSAAAPPPPSSTLVLGSLTSNGSLDSAGSFVPRPASASAAFPVGSVGPPSTPVRVTVAGLPSQPAQLPLTQHAVLPAAQVILAGGAAPLPQQPLPAPFLPGAGPAGGLAPAPAPLEVARVSGVPAGTQALVAGECVTMPPLPASLTEGLSSPEAIDAQKGEYLRSLDEQQQQGEAILRAQVERQREYIRAQAAQQKEIANGRWDQHLRSQEMAAEQEYQQQLARLREAARDLKAVLSTQASQLVVEYDARQVQQELNQKTYDLQLQKWEADQHDKVRVSQSVEERYRAAGQLMSWEYKSQQRHRDLLPELPTNQWIPVAGAKEAASGYGQPDARQAAAAQLPYPPA